MFMLEKISRCICFLDEENVEKNKKITHNEMNEEGKETEQCSL